MDKICSFPECTGKVKAKGLCGGHRQQQRRGKTLKPLRVHPEPGALCIFPECPKFNYARGYCMGHWKQVRLGKELTALKKRDKGTWGEAYLNSGGYLLRTRYNIESGEKEDLLEHRRVMEEILDRKLLPKENVHHINGVRDDNRPENLELWSSSQPPGQRVEDKVQWAKELLKTYEPQALVEREE